MNMPFFNNQSPPASPKAAPQFRHVIAFGYSDGPTCGAVECANGSEHYRFELLDADTDGHDDHEAWDRGQELRVFGLAPLPAATYAAVVSLLETVEPPRWPIWLPGVAHTVAYTDPAIARAESLLNESAAPMRLIVAGSSLIAPLTAARHITGENISALDHRTWLSLLDESVPP